MEEREERKKGDGGKEGGKGGKKGVRRRKGRREWRKKRCYFSVVLTWLNLPHIYCSGCKSSFI